MNESALRFENMVVRFRRGPVVGPVSFAVPRGTCFGLVGANGAGKTTLLRALVGLQRPAEGQVFVRQEPVVADRLPSGLAAMIEEPRFYDWLPAADNLRAVAAGRRERLARVEEVLRRVGLDPSSRRPVQAFSQGMRQRLGIARVLLTAAETMVFDEPTNGLDPVGIRWFRNLTGELVAEGHTVVMSSHLLHEVQLACQNFLMLVDGTVVAAGEVAEVAAFSSLEDMYFAALPPVPAVPASAVAATQDPRSDRRE